MHGCIARLLAMKRRVQVSFGPNKGAYEKAKFENKAGRDECVEHRGARYVGCIQDHKEWSFAICMCTQRSFFMAGVGKTILAWTCMSLLPCVSGLGAA